MFEQKFTNTNKILQCEIFYCAEFTPPDFAQLNTAYTAEAQIAFSVPASGSFGCLVLFRNAITHLCITES
jgi:hypothetical protein